MYNAAGAPFPGGVEPPSDPLRSNLLPLNAIAPYQSEANADNEGGEKRKFGSAFSMTGVDRKRPLSRESRLVARLQRSGGRSVLEEVDVARLTEILTGKSSPEG